MTNRGGSLRPTAIAGDENDGSGRLAAQERSAGAVGRADAANRRRRDGRRAREAAIDAGVRRFRPIVLTSLTTFCGLAPMIFETSLQARFLVPMAISLGFGVLFVSVIALIIVPAAYVVFDDVGSLARRAR